MSGFTVVILEYQRKSALYDSFAVIHRVSRGYRSQTPVPSPYVGRDFKGVNAFMTYKYQFSMAAVITYYQLTCLLDGFAIL